MCEFSKRILYAILRGRVVRWSQLDIDGVVLLLLMWFEFVELRREGYTLHMLRSVWCRARTRDAFFFEVLRLLDGLQFYCGSDTPNWLI